MTGAPVAARRDPVAAWKRRLVPVNVAGLRTYVLDEGLGAPVLLLHGIPTQAFLWRDVARGLAGRWRVVAPDLLGFGLADTPETADVTPRGQAVFLGRVLDQLGVDPCLIVGHDYGALVAAELLAREPQRVRGLVLLNTSFWREDWAGTGINPLMALRLPLVGEAALKLARPFMLKMAMRAFVSEQGRLNAATMAVYWYPFDHGFARTLLQLYRSQRLVETDFQRWRQALMEYRRPALVVWGGRDPVFRTWTGRRIANLLPNARFACLDDANHYVPEDRPHALARLISTYGQTLEG